MGKKIETIMWIGRIIIGIIVAIFIFNGLKTNPRLSDYDYAAPIGGVITGILCIVLLHFIGKKD